MNGFLLVARRNMDELPLRLFAEKVSAEHFLEYAEDEQLLNLIHTTAERLDWPTTDLVAIELMEFVDGVPVSSSVVYDPEKGNAEAAQ
jgi:hypothetical protein